MGGQCAYLLPKVNVNRTDCRPVLIEVTKPVKEPLPVMTIGVPCFWSLFLVLVELAHSLSPFLVASVSNRGDHGKPKFKATSSLTSGSKPGGIECGGGWLQTSLSAQRWEPTAHRGLRMYWRREPTERGGLARHREGFHVCQRRKQLKTQLSQEQLGDGGR